MTCAKYGFAYGIGFLVGAPDIPPQEIHDCIECQTAYQIARVDGRNARLTQAIDEFQETAVNRMWRELHTLANIGRTPNRKEQP